MRISVKKAKDHSNLDGPYKVAEVEKDGGVILIDTEGEKHIIRKNQDFDYRTLKRLSEEFKLYFYLDFMKKEYKVEEIVLKI